MLRGSVKGSPSSPPSTRLMRWLARWGDTMKDQQTDSSRGEGRQALNSILGGDRAKDTSLDARSRARMEEREGASFDHVRVHQASPEADQRNAKAFTVGQDIHFGTGFYQPDTAEGQRLIGHELTHVRQNQLTDTGKQASQGEREQEARAQAGPVQLAGTPGTPQLDIKEDLRKAMSGWGTDEEAIFSRLGRASAQEIQLVLADAKLIGELRSELSRKDMGRVLNLLNAPVEQKLQLAMSGWGADASYIRNTLNAATPEELSRVAGNATLVAQLQSALSRKDARAVLDRLGVTLGQKLRFAASGWGTDEQYIFDSLNGAPVHEVLAAAFDTATMSLLASELNKTELANARGIMARRILNDGANPERAFQVLYSDDKKTADRNFEAFGAVAQQRALTDTVIINSNDLTNVQNAFKRHWDVDLGLKDAMVDNDGDGIAETRVAAVWTVDILRRVHISLKELPEGDVRGSVWSKLTLEANSSGGWMSHGGEFGLGDGAAGVGTQPYGQGTVLKAAVNPGDARFEVFGDTSIFLPGRSATIDMGGTDAEAVTIKAADNTTKVVDIDGAFAKAHPDRTRVDVTDHHRRDVDWVAAVVRHEIGHALDTALGGVEDFKKNVGGWWWGTDIDTWGSKMGDPWKGSATPTAEEKKEIKDHILAFSKTSGGKQLNDGLDPTHAVNTHWNNNIPILEAAKACAPNGKSFWQNPSDVRSYGGYYFAVNHYYHNFQCYKAEVHENRVRDYAIFSAAEFFAEVYTVYYEEAGQTPAPTPGRLIPVASWKNWITNNVHNRGLDPSTAASSGLTHGSVGMHSGNAG